MGSSVQDTGEEYRKTARRPRDACLFPVYPEVNCNTIPEDPSTDIHGGGAEGSDQEAVHEEGPSVRMPHSRT